jgi:hypothetical protein
VTRQPIPWNPADNGFPTTLVGDPTWWGDYTVSASVLLQKAPWVELLGRVDSARGQAVSGYALRLDDDGRWQLATESAVHVRAGEDEGEGLAADRVLASGRTAASTGWRRLALRMTGSRLAVVIDGRTLATVADSTHTDGQVGLRVGGWDTSQFTNLSVVPTAQAPHLLSTAGIRATASDSQYLAAFNVDGRAQRVLDGRPATLWRSNRAPDPDHPVTLTLTLRRPERVSALVVTPRRDGSILGMVTGWRVETSTDGRSFAGVAAGSWAPSTAAHLVPLGGRSPVRAVRLVVTGSVGSCAALAELGLVSAPATGA